MPYKAFISYNQIADGKYASAVQSALHKFAKPFYKPRAIQVFRDKADLSASPALWPSIQKTIGESEYFILLASPASAQSKWVRREINYWLHIHQGSVEKLLILWTDGDLIWDAEANDFDWERTNAIPENLTSAQSTSSSQTLKGKFKEEPLYIDARWARSATDLSLRDPQFLEDIATLAATLHDKPKSEMIGEDVSQHRKYKFARTVAIFLLLIFAVLAGAAAVYAYRQRNIAIEQRNIAEANRQEAERRRQEAEDALAKETSAKLEAEAQRKEAIKARDNEKSAREAETKAKERTQVALKQETVAKQQAERRRREAERQSEIALSRQLAAEAELVMNQQTDLWQRGSLLAVEAQRRFSHLNMRSLETDQALRHALTLLTHPIKRMPEDVHLRIADFSPNQHYLAAIGSKGSEKSLYVWDIKSEREILHQPCKVCGSGIAVSSDGRLVATFGFMEIIVLDVATGQEYKEKVKGMQAESIQFSPDGRYLAAGSRDLDTNIYFMQVWEMRSASAQMKEVFHQENVALITFNPNGQNFVTAPYPGKEGDTAVWKIEKDQPAQIALMPPHTYVMSFSSEGHYLATSTYNTKTCIVKLWDASAGWKEVKNFYHKGNVTHIIFSPDGRYLATVSDPNTNMIRVWDTSEGNEVTNMVNGGEIVWYITFSPDSKYIATANWDGTVRIWLAASGQEVGRIVFHGERKSWESWKGIAFSPDSKHLAVVSDVLEIWDATRNQEVSAINSVPAAHAIAFSPDAHYLAAANSDSTLLLDAVSNQEVGRFLETANPGEVKVVVFSPHNKYLVISGAGGKSIKVWDIASKQVLTNITSEDEVSLIVFSPDEKYLILAGEGNLVVRQDNVRIFDSANNWREVGRIPRFGVGAISFSPDQRYLLTMSSSGGFESWDSWKNANPHRVLQIENVGLRRILFSPDGHYAVAGGGADFLFIWDVKHDWKQVTELKLQGETYISDVALSPDGRYLATASYDNIVRIWDDWRVKPKEITRVSHEDFAETVVFSPDSKYVASESGDIYIWEVTGGREVARIKNDLIGEGNISFSPDGKYLLSKAKASNEGETLNAARLYLIRPDDLASEVCSRLTRNLTPDEWKKYIGGNLAPETCPKITFGH